MPKAKPKTQNPIPEFPPEAFGWKPIGSVKPNPRNARTHSKKQVNEIAGSIQRFGFTNPVLVDENSIVLAGHGRLRAAQLLGMTHIPVLRFDHMSEAEKRAYVLFDNKIAEKAGWDRETLCEFRSNPATYSDFIPATIPI